MQDICERKQEAEATYVEKNLAKKVEEERDAAEKIRRTSVERLPETRKREGAESSSKLSEKKMRSSYGDTIAYLRENAEKDFKLKEEELKLRREEPELNKQREQLLLAQSGAMIQLMNKLAEKF